VKNSWILQSLLLAALASGGWANQVWAQQTGPAGPDAADSQPELRTWTAGQYRAQAVFLDFADGQVEIRLHSGKVVKVPIERLSAADRDYIGEQMALRAVPPAMPSVPPQPSPPPEPAEEPPAALDDLTWLSGADVPAPRVTEALQAIWVMPPAEAALHVERLTRAVQGASEEGRQAAAFLAAVAQERAGQPGEAALAYRQQSKTAKNTPYGVSARFRLAFLSEKLDNERPCLTWRDEPEQHGWFLTPDGWARTTTRLAALKTLVELRRNYLSVRLFDFLRERAPFPDQYRYIFVLLGVTVGSMLLALPWRVKVAAVGEKVRRVRPEIRNLASIYGSEPLEQQKALLALYRREGINFGSGCVVMVVELVFVIWVLVAMSSYSPQLALDGARFFWVPDVTAFSFHVCLVWVALVTILPVITGAIQSMGQHPCVYVAASLIMLCIFVAMAWYWQWPSYVFVFWILQAIVGQVLLGILKLGFAFKA